MVLGVRISCIECHRSTNRSRGWLAQYIHIECFFPVWCQPHRMWIKCTETARLSEFTKRCGFIGALPNRSLLWGLEYFIIICRSIYPIPFPHQSTGLLIKVGAKTETCKLLYLGLYSLNGKTSYHQVSWSLEARRFCVIIIVSLWNLTGISAPLLPKCISNFRATKMYKPESRGFETSRDFVIRRESA